MKIVEGLKKIKYLQEKASDIRRKIQNNCAKMSYESDSYENQFEKVSGWLQSHHDILREIEVLRERIALTNVSTKLTIELGGKEVTKSIHSWLSRRKDLADLDYLSWSQLVDNHLKDQHIRSSKNTSEIIEFKVVRFYNPEKRDEMLELYKSEVSIINSKLEIINAITDLLEV